MADPRQVIVIFGDAQQSGLALRALSHPHLTVQEARTEQTIVPALTNQRFDLAIVGGRVGRRGPLVLCDVVRLRQPDAPVLVVLGEESEEAQVSEHVARGLQGVQYLQLTGINDLIQRGTHLRAYALAMLQLDDDGATAEAWPRLQAEADSASDIQIEVSTGDAAPAPLPAEATISQDDLDFAQHIAAQTRNIDFRSPPSNRPAEGADRTTALLRERVRELERQLARLAYVYAVRARDYDLREHQVAEHETRRQSVESEMQRLRDHFNEERSRWTTQRSEHEGHHSNLAQQVTELQAHLNEVSGEASRLRDELMRKEQSFTGMLKQAEGAFSALRDQSARGLQALERQLQEQTIRSQKEEQETSRLRAELDASRQRLEVAMSSTGNKGPAASEEVQHRLGEVERLLGERVALAEELARLRAEVTARQAEVDRLRQETGKHDGELARLADEFRTREQALLARAEKLKETAAQFRATYDEQAASLAEREKDLAVVKAQLEARDGDVKRLSEEQRENARALERERSRSLEAVLEARLVAVEEFARMAAERISSQIEVLNAIEARSSKQENLTNRLLGVVDSLESLSPAHGAVVLKPADYRRSSKAASPRFFVVLAGGVLAVALAIWGAVIFFGGDSPAAVEEPAPPAPSAESPEPTPAVAAPQEPTPKTPEAAPEVAPTAEEEAAAPEPAKKLDAKAASERKEIRRGMFEAVKKKKWSDVVGLGLKMRAEFPMDWESEYQLADALRRLNRNDEAVEMYRGFTLRYPDNKYADEALFRLASLLHKQGKSSDAVSIYKTLADNPESKFRADATKALKSLGK